LVYLAIFAGLYVFVYFETRFNPILFLVVAILYAVLAALCLASVLIPMGALVLNLKDILAKRYERYLKRSLFWAHVFFTRKGEAYWGNGASAYLLLDKIPEAKATLARVHNPCLLETFSELRILFALEEGRNEEAKVTYLAYALQHRNGKILSERKTVIAFDALFAHLEGKEVTPEQDEAAKQEEYPLFQRLYGGEKIRQGNADGH
jgi:hypothetical protein